MSRVLTTSEFRQLCATWPHEQPVSEADGRYLGWVPVTWMGTELALTVEDCDDWKEVDLFGSLSESEALAALRLHFGEFAEIETLSQPL